MYKMSRIIGGGFKQYLLRSSNFFNVSLQHYCWFLRGFRNLRKNKKARLKPDEMRKIRLASASMVYAQDYVLDKEEHD